MFLKRWRVSDFKMAEIKYALEKRYKNYISTFKETSLDNHDKNEADIYLCYDESHEVINFDAIIENKYPDSNTRPKSFDALYFSDENVYCIEFKNQRKLNNTNLIGKLVDGKNELDKILVEINVQKNDYTFIYCVVYKNSEMPVNRYKRGIEKGEPRFSLQEYKENGLVDDIFTEDVNFFTKQFKKKTSKELAC